MAVSSILSGVVLSVLVVHGDGATLGRGIGIAVPTHPEAATRTEQGRRSLQAQGDK